MAGSESGMHRQEASMRKGTLTLALLFIVLGQSFGQTRQPVLRVAPFSGAGVGASEASTMERLVASYIVELKAFRVIDARGQELALSEAEAALNLGSASAVAAPLAADYIVGGTLGKIGDVYVFALDSTKVSSGEKLSVSDTAVSLSDIVLRSRELTRSLFGRKDMSPASHGMPIAADGQSAAATASMPTSPPASTPGPSTPNWKPSPRIADIAASWRGDKGLETVRVFQNGTGLAVLTGGGTLKLRISIKEDVIEVMQDQPNDPVLYRSPFISFETARRIAAQARPMRWIFRLDSAGQSLFGTKESIAISGSGPDIQVDNNYVREASWSRISR